MVKGFQHGIWCKVLNLAFLFEDIEITSGLLRILGIDYPHSLFYSRQSNFTYIVNILYHDINISIMSTFSYKLETLLCMKLLLTKWYFEESYIFMSKYA